MSKNCLTCKHLEWVCGDCPTGFGSGYICNKRMTGGESNDEEGKILSQLEDDKYLNRYKRCFEPNKSKEPS